MPRRDDPDKRDSRRTSGGFRRGRGKAFASCTLYDPSLKKNRRFKLPHPTDSLEDALSQRREIEIKIGIAKIRARKRFEFLQKYINQERLFAAYIIWRQKSARRSWREDVSRLNCYVFPFFIGEKSCNHPTQWFSHWQEFHAFLDKSPIKINTKEKGILSVNSKNNIIKSANSFIKFVELNESGDIIRRLPQIQFEEGNRRELAHVYSQDEITQVRQALPPPFNVAFSILASTGMRVSECLGLRAQDVVLGTIPQKERWIFNSLKGKADIYGYILLKHQLGDDGEILPLKGRRRIAPENNRVIPILGEELALLLKSLKVAATKDGFLFKITYQQLYTEFVKVRAKLKLPKQRDLHSLRHTFATNFVALCDGDPRIVEKVLGHTKAEVTRVYNHLAAQMQADLESEGVNDIVKKVVF